jgi:cytochrome P450
VTSKTSTGEEGFVTDQRTDDWDPRSDAVVADQRTAYDEMRETCPVAHSAFLGWSVFRHADAVAIANDPGSFSSATKRLAVPNGMDPPMHTQHRDALSPSFGPDHMASFEPVARRIAADLLKPMQERGAMDAIGEFANPYAHQAVCAFMGWPVEDWNRVAEWTHGNQEAAFRRDREAGAKLAREFDRYVTEIIEARRADPAADDVMTELVNTSVDGEALSNERIVSALRTWTAGHGTVAGALGIVIAHLARDAGLQQRLREEPVLIDHAVGEILRSDGPLVSNNRTATRDVEIGGRSIATGERLSLMWIAANRDPSAFEDPDSVDLRRPAEGSVLFGTGIHRCLGEPLARLELRTAVAELVRNLDGIEATSNEVPPRHVYPSNGLAELPIRFRGRAAI